MASHNERQYRLFTCAPYSWTAGTTYVFTVSGVTLEPAVGDTYTNNSVTFTLVEVNLVSGDGTLVATGSGAPAASGDLTVATGDGDETIAFSEYNKPNTLSLTLPAGCAEIQCMISAAFNAGTEVLKIDTDDYTAGINIAGCANAWANWQNTPTAVFPLITWVPDGEAQPGVKFVFDNTDAGVFSAAVYVLPGFATTVSAVYTYET